jgi:hypothetical protein
MFVRPAAEPNQADGPRACLRRPLQEAGYEGRSFLGRLVAFGAYALSVGAVRGQLLSASPAGGFVVARGSSRVSCHHSDASTDTGGG